MASLAKDPAAGQQAKLKTPQRRDPGSTRSQTKAPSSTVASQPSTSDTYDTAEDNVSLSGAISKEVGRGLMHVSALLVSEGRHGDALRAPSELGPTQTSNSVTSVTPLQTPSPKFYTFGWDAHPTFASVNEVCRDFLAGRCYNRDRCHRIHPRSKNSDLIAHPTLTSANEVCRNFLKGYCHFKDRCRHIHPPIQSTSTHIGPSAENITTLKRHLQPDNHTTQMQFGIVELVKSDELRYHSQRETLQLHVDDEADSGGASEDSRDSCPSSQCSSSPTSDEEIDIIAHPPPPHRFFCRRWLQKCCTLNYECPWVHGDLEYDVPVNGIYPAPRGREICKRWMDGACSRGYLCFQFHGDLDYYKRTGHEDVNLPAWDTQGKEKTYPPPHSNIYCKNWLLGQCDRGPLCQFFHEDVKYNPPVEGIHPPPRYPYICKRWKLADCFRGYACDFVHEDLHYDSPPSRDSSLSRKLPIPQVVKHPRPLRYPNICQQWISNRCSLEYSCEYVHLNLEYEEPTADALPPPAVLSAIVPAKPAPATQPVNDPPVGQRPPPQSQETCIQWLRNRCTARYHCKFLHEDLEYDPSKIALIPPPASNKAGVSSATIEGRAWSLKVHDHARIKLGPGFGIQELETGFETPWVYLGNIPVRVTEKDIETLLLPFGEVADLRLPGHMNNPTMLVRARFTTSASARDASTALHNSQTFDTKITARLPIHVQDASQNAVFSDTSVRIRWEAPSRAAYCGYSTMELAEAGIQAARKVFRDRYVHASVHIGLPVVGVVTVRFRGLPLGLTRKDMAWFADPDDVVWAQPNYEKLDAAKSSIQQILKKDFELVDFVVQPAPYKNGLIQAWAHFATAGDAKAACSRLHGRKPLSTGRTRIVAQHTHTLTFSVLPSTYQKIQSDIQILCQKVYDTYRTSMTVVERSAPMKTRVKLVGDDLKELGQLKAEIEKLLNWETVRQGAIIAWDPFFAQPAGLAFLSTIQETTSDVTIYADSPRQMIRLLGSSKSRISVKQRILIKLAELQAQQIRTIPLDGWSLGQFMRTDLALLQNQFGRENIDLDLYHRRLVVRSDETIHQTVREAVDRVRQAQLHPSRRRNIVVCPVCYDEVTNPITLPCGHRWCRDCLTHYLTSSANHKYFPLACLGKNAKCTEHIPLHIARKLLTISEFDTIVDAAFAAYVQARGDEFHYCPTPDCPQIYRRAPRDTVLQCPSCLLRICPNCHVEAHDGFACPDPEGDKQLFREWMEKHDVKPCPGCKVLIERSEGCNHMTCTQCKTHICWVCMKTFPGGDGIYSHMRAEHGSIGLLQY